MGHEGQAGNAALRMMLDEAELTNAGLARAVVAAGAEEGIHVGTNVTSIRRMLDGSQPRWPVPRLVAKVVSRRLSREVGVTECGFLDQTPVSEDPHEGLRCSATLDGTVRTVVELSGRDMNRRKFLLGSSFSAAAFSQPALFALTVPPVESTARRGGSRVGMTEVALLTDQVTHLRQLDYRYGAGGLREQVVSLLHREANQLLHASYSDRTGKALLTAVAQVTKLAGFTAADLGRHALAQRYFVQGLDLAMAAGDRRYAAAVLSEMGWMTAQIGRNALTEHDRLQHGRQTVALARAGLAVTHGAATLAQAAELHVLEAGGFALVGDAREAHRAMVAAQRSYESMCPAEEPPWLGLYTEAAFAADLGKCLGDLGEAEQAIKQSSIAVHDYEPGGSAPAVSPRPISPAPTSSAATSSRPRRRVGTRCAPPPRSAPPAPSTGCAPCNARSGPGAPAPRTCASWTNRSRPCSTAPTPTETRNPPDRTSADDEHTGRAGGWPTGNRCQSRPGRRTSPPPHTWCWVWWWLSRFCSSWPTELLQSPHERGDRVP